MSEVNVTKFFSKEALEAELVKKAEAKARAEAEKLWAESEKVRRLANLHQELGYRSTADLIEALKEASAGKVSAKKEKGAKRTRVAITDAIRAKVKELAAGGKKAPTIAKEVGISAPSVYNILGNK